MTLRRIRFVLVIVAVSTIALVGCAPARSTPTAGPTHTAKRHTPVTHSAPPAIDQSAPAAQVSTACSGLITPAELVDWQGPGTPAIAPAAIATGDLADPTILIPVSDYVRAAGGLECLWAAGPFDHYNPDATVVPSYLEITVQFTATAEYNLNAASLGADNGRAGECDVDNPGSICQIDDLVGGTWIEIYSRKAVGTGAGAAGISAIENSVLAAVTAAGSPAGTPAPQAGTTPLGTTCTDFASATAVQAAVGSSAALAASTPAQAQPFGSALATPVWLPSENALKNHPCVFSSGATTQVSIGWLPGGAWVWNENRTQTLTNGPLQNLHLTGEGVNDSASIRCAASNTACTVDLVLGGNWIEATVPATSTAANKRTAVTAVAQAIVSKLG